MFRSSLVRPASCLARRTVLPQRTLATAAAPTQEWLVLLPDRKGMLEKRIEVRPAHLKAVAPDVKSGKVILGGATLAKPLEPGQPAAMTGSVFIKTAHSKEDIVAWLKSDIYGSSGVWDIENAQIIPMRVAVRKGLPDLGTDP